MPSPYLTPQANKSGVKDDSNGVDDPPTTMTPFTLDSTTIESAVSSAEDFVVVDVFEVGYDSVVLEIVGGREVVAYNLAVTLDMELVSVVKSYMKQQLITNLKLMSLPSSEFEGRAV